MSLYEVINGYMGESYIRVYVWCETPNEARVMAAKKFKASERCHSENYWHNLKVKLLFDATEPAFVSMVSDSTFERELE